MSADLKSLSTSLYEGHGRPRFAMPYFSQFRVEILSYDRVEFMAYQMRLFPLDYVVQLFLSIPELWLQFQLRDWRRMLVSVERPAPLKEDYISSGAFADLELLCRYIGVDGLGYFMGLDVSEEKKWNALQHFLRTFFLEEYDEDDLDGRYLVGTEQLRSVRMRMLDAGLDLMPERRLVGEWLMKKRRGFAPPHEQ